jgi:CRP-like cAMP-binding protein
MLAAFFGRFFEDKKQSIETRLERLLVELRAQDKYLDDLLHEADLQCRENDEAEEDDCTHRWRDHELGSPEESPDDDAKADEVPAEAGKCLESEDFITRPSSAEMMIGLEHLRNSPCQADLLSSDHGRTEDVTAIPDTPQKSQQTFHDCQTQERVENHWSPAEGLSAPLAQFIAADENPAASCRVQFSDDVKLHQGQRHRWGKLSKFVSIAGRLCKKSSSFPLDLNRKKTWRRGSSTAARILKEQQVKIAASGVVSADLSIDNDGVAAGVVDALFVASSIFSCMLAITLQHPLNQFDEDVPSAPFIVWFSFQGVLSAFWMWMRAYTRIRNGWDVIGDLKIIRASYLATWFKFDLFLCFPLELCFVGWSRELFRIFVLRHFLRYFRIFSLGSSTNPLLPSRKWLQFLTFVLTMFLVTHCVANLFWSFENHMQKQPMTYLMSLYWAAITMTSVGYGDFAAKTDVGMGLSIAAMMLGVFLVANFMSGVIYFATSRDHFEKQIKDRQNMLIAMLKYLNVADDDLREFAKHYQIIYSNYSENVFSSHLQYLPEFMEAKLKNHFNAALLGTMSIFKGVSEDMLVQLSGKMSKHSAGPSDVIFAPGENSSELVFVVSGTVQLVRVGENGEIIVVEEIKEGGVVGPLTGDRAGLEARIVSGKVDFVKVGAKDLVETIDEMPELSMVTSLIATSFDIDDFRREVREEEELAKILAADLKTVDWSPYPQDADGPARDRIIATWGREPRRRKKRSDDDDDGARHVENLDEGYEPVEIPQVVFPTVQPSFTFARIREHRSSVVSTNQEAAAPVPSRVSAKSDRHVLVASSSGATVSTTDSSRPIHVSSTTNLPASALIRQSSGAPPVGRSQFNASPRSSSFAEHVLLVEDQGGQLALSPRAVAFRELYVEWFALIGDSFDGEDVMYVLRYVPVSDFSIGGVEASLHPPFLEKMASFVAAVPVAEFYEFLHHLLESLTDDQVVSLSKACCRVIFSFVASELTLIVRKAAIQVFRELTVLITSEGLGAAIRGCLARIPGVNLPELDHLLKPGIGAMTLASFVELIQRLCGPTPQRILSLLRFVASHFSLTLEKASRSLFAEQRLWRLAESDLDSTFSHCFDGVQHTEFFDFASFSSGDDSIERLKLCVAMLVMPPAALQETFGLPLLVVNPSLGEPPVNVENAKKAASKLFSDWAARTPDEFGELLIMFATFHSGCNYLSFSLVEFLASILLNSDLHPSALLPRSRVAHMLASWALLVLQKVCFLRKWSFPMIFVPAEVAETQKVALTNMRAVEALQPPYSSLTHAELVGGVETPDVPHITADWAQRSLASTPEPPDM